MWPHCDLVLSSTISIVLAHLQISYSSIKITLDSSACGEYTWGGSRLVLGMLVRIGT